MLKGLCSWRSVDSERERKKGRRGKELKVSLYGMPINPQNSVCTINVDKGFKNQRFQAVTDASLNLCLSMEQPSSRCHVVRERKVDR